MAWQDNPTDNQTNTQLLNKSKQLIKAGDTFSAKHAAKVFVCHYPDQIEGWLILAGLSTPEQSLTYIDKARLIDPDDPRLIKAETWAEQKLSLSAGDGSASRSTTDNSPSSGLSLPITPPVLIERRGIVWHWALVFILLSALGFIGLGIAPSFIATVRIPRGIHAFNELIKPTQPTLLDQDLDVGGLQDETQIPEPEYPEIAYHAPEPETSVISAPNLYGCEMEITFISGPLIGGGTDFHMLDESYFFDKGDKFDTGKNTGIYYIDQAYVILHSGFHMGNRNLPLEIEFLRSYLELWGEEDTGYIENQISALIGSEMVWRCQGEEVYRLRVRDVVRLSHQASDRLWLEPENILQIIESREGRDDEWIGALPNIDEQSLLLGFCGWGPPEVQVNRSTYYRYVIDFEVLD